MMDARLHNVLRSEPLDPPHVGTIDARRQLHGGTIKGPVVMTILTHEDLLDMNSIQNRERTIVEFGAGSGLVSFFAAAISTNPRRRILSIEKVRRRVDRMRRWAASMRENGAGVRPPTILHGDYTIVREEDPLFVPHLTAAIDVTPPLMYVNNANQCIANTERNNGISIQSLLEQRLADCPLGSVIVSLDRLFIGNLYWHEEAYTSRVKRRDVSWMAGTADDEKVEDFPIFRYIKKAEAEEGGVGGRRRRHPIFQQLSENPVH